MDTGSPVSLDFGFPYSEGTPGASSNNGYEAHPMGIKSSATSAFPNLSGVGVSGATSRRHRPSIDSIFDRDILQSPAHNKRQHRNSEATVSSQENHENLQDEGVADNGHPPSWSELKTKAGKERKRLPLACIACRRKKIKCSGEKPACKHCMRARIVCVYKVTARKAAPRTDYMAMLDKRLKRMEDRVIKMIPKEDLPDLNVTGRSVVRPPLPGQPIKKEKIPGKKRSAEEAFDAEMKDWVETKQPVEIEGAVTNRFLRDSENKLVVEGSEALPLHHIQEHLAELFFDCVYGQSYLLLHKPSFMRKLKAGTVPPVLILAVCAVSARFSTHPHVSTEPAFLRGEQWATPARSIIEKRHFEPNVTILTSMVILGLHYFGTCEGGLSWSFGGQAMRLGYALQLHRELDHDPLGRAQAGRVTNGKGTPKLPELSFIDREIRRRLMWACYLMDTFNSSGTERPSFLNEDYMKIQLPIKESHFQLELPGLTEDLEGHVTVPNGSNITPEEAQAEAKSNMGVAAYIMRGVVIWKKVVQYLNLGGKEKDAHQIWDPLSQFAALQRQIVQLNMSLPSSLKYTPENLATHVSERLANQFLFLHIVLAQDNLFLHRFAIPTAPNVHRPYPPNTPKPFLASCATTVVESAGLISKIVADSTGCTFTVPFAGYCAYASATVHIWGIFSKNPRLELSSKENLRHNYRYLTRMKRYWGMFHYMAESIKDIYRAFADASARAQLSSKPNIKLGDNLADTLANVISADASRAASPTRDPTGATGKEDDEEDEKGGGKSVKPMFQYGDWFNKYPHGVSETEWETSHLPHKKESQKGTEAVMSQRSELQSVEEFFASLSPPSKAAEQELVAGQRGKKIARRRGKSVVENANTAAAIRAREQQQQGQSPANKTARTPSHPQPATPNQSHIPSQAPTSNPSALRHSLDLNTSDIDIPMSEYTSQPLQSQPGTAFDMSSTSPSVFQQPQSAQSPFPNSAHHRPSLGFDYDLTINSPSTASNPATVANYNNNPIPSTSNQMNFNFNYTSALPHLDRQMVFGAYAGIDPSTTTSSSALNNPNNLDFWSNPWDTNNSGAIDMDGFEVTGFSDAINPANMAGGGMGSNNNNNNNMNSNGVNTGLRQNESSNGMGSSAWFMPFNIEPPSFPGLEDFGGFDEMGPGQDSLGDQGASGGA